MSALTIKNLNNGQLDLQHIAEVATSPNSTAIDRTGRSKPTLQGAIDSLKSYNVIGGWTTPRSYEVKDVVSNGGTWYIAVERHNSGATFVGDAQRWRVFQGEVFQRSDLGGVARPLADKVRESVATSITDAGGIGNYDPVTGAGKNCVDALSLIAQVGPAALRVKFPALVGQSNNYLLSFPAGYTVSAGSVIIDADPGVTLYSQGVKLACDFVRPTKVVTVAAPTPSVPMTYEFQPGGAQPNPSESDKDRWLSAADIVLPSRAMYDPRSGWRPLLVAWGGNGGGDAAGSVAGSTKVMYDATSIVITASASAGAPADGALHAGFVRPMVGDEIGARLDIASGATGFQPAVIVRSATAHEGVLFSVQGASTFKKIVGSPFEQGAAGAAGLDSHQSYSPFSSIVTFRLLTPYRFQVMVQGLVVHEGEMSEPIQEVGFGCYLSGDCTVRWTDLFLSRGHSPAAARTVGLFTIGDSITADGPGCWARRCRAALEGSFGVRVVQYHNQAVSGHDSAAQLDILRANGVPGGTTHSVVQLGTNDIQGGVPVANMVANYSEIFDRLKAAGSKIVAGIPPLWYTQAQAGARGVASLNYERGTTYRMAIMRLCAARNIPVLDSLPAYGPILANFVNPAYVPDLTGRDPMVFDNLHPGSYMAKLMGFGYAGLLLGQMTGVGTNAVSWTPLPATWATQNGWTVFAAEGASFSISASGERQFQGTYNVGATHTAGTTIQSLGRLLWPRRARRFDAYTNTGERVLMVLEVDGQLKMLDAIATGALLYLDSGAYPVN